MMHTALANSRPRASASWASISNRRQNLSRRSTFTRSATLVWRATWVRLLMRMTSKQATMATDRRESTAKRHLPRSHSGAWCIVCSPHPSTQGLVGISNNARCVPVLFSSSSSANEQSLWLFGCGSAARAVSSGQSMGVSLARGYTCQLSGEANVVSRLAVTYANVFQVSLS